MSSLIFGVSVTSCARLEGNTFSIILPPSVCCPVYPKYWRDERVTHHDGLGFLKTDFLI